MGDNLNGGRSVLIDRSKQGIVACLPTIAAVHVLLCVEQLGRIFPATHELLDLDKAVDLVVIDKRLLCDSHIRTSKG